MLALRRPKAALAAYQRALAVRSGYLEARIGGAAAKKQLGRLDEALRDLDAVLALRPESDHARNNKAALLLSRGDFVHGWDLYESRWIANGTPKHALKLSTPEWEGQALAGKRIVVFDEQGFGDSIQFVRFCLELAELGADVTFFCRARLHRLFASLPRKNGTPIRLIDRLESRDLEGGRFDYQIALCSLPRALRTRLETIPARTPYLAAEAPLVEKWAARLGPQGFKIGVCWRGSANPKADGGRAAPLEALSPLAAEGVRLISLQMPDRAAGETRDVPWLERLGAEFDAGPDAFVDTAAVMQHLDVIVTCDTSVAHLAGALGRPVIVLLPAVADWRWLLDREDCPWYPSMRLVRQRIAGEWAGPVARVREMLGHASGPGFGKL